MALKKNPGFGYYIEGANNTAPTFNSTTTRLSLLRLVQEDLNTNLAREESNEVRGDAQSSGSTIVGANAGGSIQLQYSLDTYDDLIVGMLYAPTGGTGRESGWNCDGFTAIGDIMGSAGSVTFDASADALTSTALFAAANVAAGDLIYVTGFGNRNLDTIWRVAAGTTPTASEIILENDTGAIDIAAYAGIAGDVTKAGVMIRPVKGYTRNGTFERKFGFVRFYSDTDLAGTTGTSDLAAVDWRVFRGGVVTSLQLAAAPRQAGWTGTLSVLLKDEGIVENASGGTNLGAFNVTNWNQLKVQNTYSLANAIKSVVMVRLRKIGDAQTAAVRVDPLSFNFTASNNATEIEATRNLGALDINLGTYSAQIGLSLLYIDPTYHAAMLADDAYEVEVGVADAEGHCQLWRFPKGRLTSEAPNPGKNNPIQQNLTFTCEAGGDGYQLGAGLGRQIELLKFYIAA
jgi:hypothetical protein